MVGSRLGHTALSGRYGPHLQRRNGVFHFRMRVPAALQLRVGLVEVVRSLRTFNPSKARLLAARCAMRVTEAFEVIKSQELTRDDTRRLVQNAFVSLAAEVDDGYCPATSRPDLELREQAFLAEERLAQLDCALTHHDYPQQAILLAETALGSGLLDGLSDPRRADLAQGMTRALMEQQRLFLFRLSERMLPWVPADVLFREVDCKQTPSFGLAAYPEIVRISSR